MEEWLTIQDIEEKYKHISLHSFPFESIVVKIIPQKGCPFSERWKFLKGLFYITEDNYYFQYSDICRGLIDTDQDGQPYDIFLDGILRYVYSLAYTNSSSTITDLILTLLSEGKIFGAKDRYNKSYYLFSDYYYSYLPPKYYRKDFSRILYLEDGSIKRKFFWNLPVIWNSDIKEKENFEGFRLVPFKDFDVEKVDNFYDRFWTIKNSLGYFQLYDVSDKRLLDTFFDEIHYGNYIFNDNNGDSYGVDDYIFRKDDKWGCLDGDGKVLIPCEYDRIEHLIACDGREETDKYLIWINEKVGLFDKKSGICLRCLFDEISCIYYCHDLYKVKQGLYYSICLVGSDYIQMRSMFCFEDVKCLQYDNYKNYYLAVKKDGKYAIIKIIDYEKRIISTRIMRTTNYLTEYIYDNLEDCESALKELIE